MSSDANLARIAFRLPDALDPPITVSDRIRLAAELLAAAQGEADGARDLSAEARWKVVDRVTDLLDLAQKQVGRGLEELESIRRSRPSLEERKAG
jgi:hypothetical protein